MRNQGKDGRGDGLAVGGNWGRPVSDEGCGLNGAVRRRSARESDRVVRCAGQRPDQEG